MRRSIATAMLLFGLAATAGGETIDLSGSWRFQLDPNDVGIVEAWYAKELTERLELPGALQNQGFGNPVTVDTEWTGAAKKEIWLNEPCYEKYRQPGNIKVPFCLQPERHYVGAAWYQRQIKIPRRWQDEHVTLTLERPHWETRVWVDERFIGRTDSLGTAHEYDLGALSPGKHTLTIRVDNRIIVDVGDWSHSVTDHTQGNWNGIVGRIELAARPAAWISELHVYPHVRTRSITVKGRVATDRRQAGEGTLQLSVEQLAGPKAETPPSVTKMISWGPDGQAFEFSFPEEGSLQLWDEFTPVLYQLTAALDNGAEKVTTFGVREITTTPDKLFAINGRKTFLRGTLECCIFPLTGYPPTDVKSWKRIIRICKEHGLNHIRFHSWCPPEAAFVAADELGFYYQVECGVWTNPGNGTPVDEWLWNESERIVRAYGNHPSFVLLASGNEPHGPKREEYLNKWVEHWQAQDPRRLHTTASAYPLLPINDYHVDYHPRGPKGWNGKDYVAEVAAHEVPVIVHEMGQWCVYPNFDEIKKYRGPLKPKNFEIFRDSLSEHGMLDQWRDFLHASGKLQVLCYKEEIEAALRTPGISGIQLLDLHDFPGQGTALVGILDAFWDEKGYVEPEQFRRFYGTTVPLARLEKRAWTTDETFRAEVTVAHFAATPLQDAQFVWELTSAKGKVVREGAFPARTIPVDRGIELGRVAFNWSELHAPGKYRLTVRLKDARIENDWVLWLFPTVVDTESPKDVLVSSLLDQRTRARLAEGGKVLLLLTHVPGDFPKGSFSPIFWNRYMFNTQARQTLGLLCDPTHPALEQFATDAHSAWQWEDIVSQSRAIVMDELPGGLRPIVQYIDDWNTNRKLGLVFECRVREGRLLVCSADLKTNIRSRPVARQLRRSLLDYMASKAFDPKVEVTMDQLRSLYREPSVLERLGATATADSAQGGYEARLAIDDDPATIWHTAWDPTAPLPHHLTVDLKDSLPVRGLTYLPRQDMSNGRIAQYEVHVSTDGTSWEQVVSGRWADDAERKTVRFESLVTARYLKLVALSEVNGQDFTSVAEIDVPLQ